MKKLILLYLPFIGIYTAFKYPQETITLNAFHFFASASMQAIYTCILIAYLS